MYILTFLNFLIKRRFSPREGASGKQQHSLRNFFVPCNDITAMHTWMQRNKMPLMCELVVATSLDAPLIFCMCIL